MVVVVPNQPHERSYTMTDSPTDFWIRDSSLDNGMV